MPLEMTVRARTLRKKPTMAEKALWEKLRKRRFHGKKFLRQHPFYFQQYPEGFYYIADFYCAKWMLIIELDGGIHSATQEYDRIRDGQFLEQKGIRVLRLKNNEVRNFTKVERKILQMVNGS